MSQPSYPHRGLIPWDTALKNYIDYGDSQSQGSSLLFNQQEAMLTTSLPWRAASSVAFNKVSVTVSQAVASLVTIVNILVNGEAVTNLTLALGATTNSKAVSIVLEEGDLLSVARLSVDGGACLIQFDRG